MKNIKITKRNKNGFLISMLMVGLGYISSFHTVLLVGLGCLIFVLVDVLSDNTMVKS